MTLSVHIAGAGPAGCATAISLQKTAQQLGLDISVRLILPEDKALPLIGETIPPAATQYLNEMGLAHVLSSHHLECPGSISLWGNGVPGHNDFLFTPVGKGYHLDRLHFNRQLVQACASSGITVLRDTKVAGVKPLRNGLEIELRAGHQHSIVHTDFIVDASGFQARLARNMGVVRNEYDSVISLCAFYDLAELNDKPAHTLVSTSPCGWWYAARLPGQKALISFCTDAKTLKQFNLADAEIWFQHFQKSSWFHGACTEQFERIFSMPETLHLRVAPSSILSNCAGKNWLAVGDAASSYDSVTSAGITKALAQGKYAGEQLANYLHSGDKQFLALYQQQVFADFNQYLRLHQQLYTAEQRYPQSEFWQRRAVTRNNG